MSYLLYYRNRYEGRAAVDWLKANRPDLQGYRLEDVITLDVDTLSSEELATIREATGFTECIDESEFPS